MKNLLQRTASGIVYLIVIIGSFFLGKYAFGVVFLIAGSLALLEFFNLAGMKKKMAVVSGLFVGAAIFLLTFFTAANFIDLRNLTIITIFPLIFLITFLYSKNSSILKDFSQVCLGIIYISIPLSLANYLVFPSTTGHIYTYRIFLGILILVWVNDTGAYVSGVTAGRHKLFPRISPKKSWEGLIGGTLFTFIASYFMSDIMGMLNILDWLILAAIVSVFGIYGDLTESLIKRTVDKKDSGKLIPGHGGVLDRVDSVLFVIPAAFVYLIWTGIC